MANIDSIQGLERKVRRHFKRVFSELNDQFFIREPLIENLKIAPVIIEGPSNSWLFVGWHQEMLTNDELIKLDNLISESAPGANFKINYLLVTDDSIETNENIVPKGVLIAQKNDFYENGHNIIINSLSELSEENNAIIKKHLFPESIIPLQISTRSLEKNIDSLETTQQFFLDYDQELATRMDILESVNKSEEEQEGFSVRLINGVAGSGKTLILINRAIALLKKHPNEKIILLIHNKPIVEDIKLRFNKIFNDIPKNLDIRTFHSFAAMQKKRVSQYVEPLFYDYQISPYRDKIFTDSNENYNYLTLKDDQLWSEIDYINEYMIQDEQAYLEMERQGRGFALQKSQREHIWQVYLKVIDSMSNIDGYLPSLYIKEMALLKDPLDLKNLKKYDHILIDEAQFFAPSWLQLVRNSLSSDGSVFLCADPNQGFLKSRLSWKSVGFNVRNRTKKISYSYRTTYEIMAAANSLLKDLNDNTDDFVQPILDKMKHGEKPRVILNPSHQDEHLNFLRELKTAIDTNKFPLQQIMILFDGEYNAKYLKVSIEKEIGDGTVINFNDSKDIKNGIGNKIRLISINSCTGMESGITFVLGAGSLLNKTKNIELTDSEREASLQESYRKLYVAMTRAGQRLVIFSTEMMPENMNEHISISGNL